jgi:hypothetical protein
MLPEGNVVEVFGDAPEGLELLEPEEPEGNRKLRKPNGLPLEDEELEGLLCGEPKLIVDSPLLESELFVVFVLVSVFCVFVEVCGA